MLFVHCRAHRRLRANTSGKIKRSSGCSVLPSSLPSPTLSYRDCRVLMHSTESKPKPFLREALLLTQSESWPAWPWRWRANNKLGQNRVSLKGIYVWGANSKVTKQSDHYVWKDTSECVVRRCDDTVDKRRVNSCLLKHLFVERVEQRKMSPKNPGNAFSDALLMSCFQNFAADAAKNNYLKPRFARF